MYTYVRLIRHVVHLLLHVCTVTETETHGVKSKKNFIYLEKGMYTVCVCEVHVCSTHIYNMYAYVCCIISYNLYAYRYHFLLLNAYQSRYII